MSRPIQLRPTSPDELPAPRIDADSATVLTEAIDALAAIRTPTGSVTPACTCTP
jgi:hypothetical protein